jgi:hypothetical protein
MLYFIKSPFFVDRKIGINGSLKHINDIQTRPVNKILIFSDKDIFQHDITSPFIFNAGNGIYSG